MAAASAPHGLNKLESAGSMNSSFTELDSTGALSTRIVDELIERVTDPMQRPALRLAAAAYLASFLARASFLHPRFLAQTLRRLASWCWATVESASSGAGVTGVARVRGEGLSRGFGSSFAIDENGGGSQSGSEGEDPRETRPQSNDTEHTREFANATAATLTVFDSACQALMYVLCYRMESLVKHGGEPAEHLRSMPLRQILYSRLQPLHTCLDSVIKEFLFRAAAAGVEGFDQALFEQYKLESAARKEAEKAKKELISKKGGGLMSVEDVAAQHHSTGHNNNMIRRTQSLAVLGREVAEAVKLRNPLKMFFPFDPYLLRRSAALLRLPQNYVTWQGNARDDEDGSENDDDDGDLELDSELGSEDIGESSSDDDGDGGIGRRDSQSSRGMKPGSGSLPNSLGYPNSLNPRPRKLTRGLRGPQPLFGGGSNNSPSPTGGPGGGNNGVAPPGANPFARASVGAAGNSPETVVGFGVPGAHNQAWARGGVPTGVPTGVGFGRGGSVSPTRREPSPLGSSPLPPRPPRPN